MKYALNNTLCRWNGAELDYNQDDARQIIVNWIDGTGGLSSAFDFPLKGILQVSPPATRSSFAALPGLWSLNMIHVRWHACKHAVPGVCADRHAVPLSVGRDTRAKRS